MMQPLCSSSGLTPEATTSTPNRQHTPPYTPTRLPKRRLERSATPASRASSTHPAETISPAKKIARRSSTDNIKVEELTEGDLGYMTDVDVIYPDELEENSTDTDEDGGTMTDVSDSEAAGLTRRLSRLRCGDDRELDFEQWRQQVHLDKRVCPRTFKRSHSQSVRNESSCPDPEAMADHDVGNSQRRLRRRTRGPDDVPRAISGLPPASPTSGSGYVTAVEGGVEIHDTATPASEAMDVDVDGIAGH